MKQAFAALLSLFMLCGCVRSLHPFYTDSQLIFDPSLLGTWTDSEKKNTFIVTGEPDQCQYRIAYTGEDGKTADLVGHLARVGDRLIADLTVDELQTDHSDAYKAYFVPVHSFFLVEIKSDSLRLRTMNYNWFKDYVKQHPEAIKAEQIDSDYLITAPPEQAQAFILKHIDTEGAYGDWAEFRRVQPTTAP